MDYSKLSPEELIKLLQEKDQQVIDSEGVISDLKKDLADKEDEIMTLSPVVKVGEDSYEIVIPSFKLYDEKEQTITEYTAKDVQTNELLAAKLVKQGSGVLLKKEKSK